MRVKIVLLFVAALSTAALVASAQQSTYVIRPDDPADQQEAAKNGIPGPKRPLFGGGAARKNAGPFGKQGPQTIWRYTGEGLTSEADLLAQQLAAAKSDPDRDKIKGQLAEILEQQFDQRQKRHEEELKELEAQVKKLKDLVDKRQENRRDIIRARLAQIEKEAQGLGW